MRKNPKKNLDRLLLHVQEKDPEAFQDLLREAKRRGEIAGVVDLPFRLLAEIMEEARTRKDYETALSMIDYSRYLFRLWRAFARVSEAWADAAQKADMLWGPVIPKGKWHQITGVHEATRCGTYGEVVDPTPLSEIDGGKNSKKLCQRCLNEAKKNWRTLEELDKNK
ncbi:MAG: hypothetical protein GF334_08265, partial [Candidatus Altiarchaeales archaeon]|nr:hypothetical protein [Candidatus Altiarchaeales archaeon]